MPLPGNLHFATFKKCNFGQLTTYESQIERVIHGSLQQFEQLVQYIIENPSTFGTLTVSRSVADILHGQFNVKSSLEGIASYSKASVVKLYPALKLDLLPLLINTHLREHFLRIHPVLAVIDPIEDSHLKLFRRRIIFLATSIAACPSSPLAGSCPPGQPHCKPCKYGSVIWFRSLINVPSNAHVFVAVPHPLTFLSYLSQRSYLSPRFVRDSKREEWIVSVTTEILDKRAGGYQRIQMLKDIVDVDRAAVTDTRFPGSTWQTWEEFDPEGLQFTLGFKLDASDLEKDNKSSPAADMDSVAFSAKTRVLSQNIENTRDIVESWNLAWTELWYYIRASQRHRKSERLDIFSSLGFDP